MNWSHLFRRLSIIGSFIARNHDRGTGAFAFGKLPRGSDADLQLLYFSADDRTVEIRLSKGVLNTAPPSASSVASFEINTGAADLGYRACFGEGRSFYDCRSEGEHN